MLLTAFKCLEKFRKVLRMLKVLRAVEASHRLVSLKAL